MLHMLFSVDEESCLDEEISETALKAAVNFVQVACQQTAYIAGRGKLSDEVEKFKTGKNAYEAAFLKKL